jgi:DegV family protein with EDD domain
VTVIVVTDSSARIPADEVRKLGIRIAPRHILVDGRDLRDGVDQIPFDLYERNQVTTAGATPVELSELYAQALADSGGDGVVAVHISGSLSSTLNSARQAAREFDGAVRVVDSKSAALGTGFIAIAAARCARVGGDLDSVAAEAESLVSQVFSYVVVQRLDNLRRSGRIGTAASWVGTALALKPVLKIDESGRLVLAQRVRTSSKATAAMVEQVLEIVGEGRASLAVHHIENAGGAAQVAATLAAALPGCGPAIIADLGPVLGVHLGVGSVAVVVQMRAEHDATILPFKRVKDS